MIAKRLCTATVTFIVLLGPLPIVVDDTAEDISYRSANGSWTTLFNQDPALGFRDNTMTLSSTKGDSISWTFKGLDVEYWAGTGPDRGPCLIEFDGEPQGEVTGHAAVHGPPTRLFKKSSLDPLVDHTIRIVVSSDKTPNLCDLDKFIYIPVPDKSMTKAIGQPAKHETSPASQQTASDYPSLLTHQEVWILPQLSTFLWTASGSAAGIVIFVLFLFGVCCWPPRYHPRPQKNPTQEQSLLDLRIRVPSTKGSRSLPTEPVPAAPPPPPALPQPTATPAQPGTASPVDDASAESAEKAAPRLEGPKSQHTNVNGLTAVLAPEGPTPSSSGSNVPTPPLVQKLSSAGQLTSQPSTAPSSKQPSIKSTQGTGTGSSTTELLIITCMDAQLDTRRAFGHAEGDAHVIRNTGGRAKDAIPHVLQSLNGSVPRRIVVVHHTECGMVLSKPQVHAVGTEKRSALTPSEAIKQAVREDVKLLKEHSQLKGIDVEGWILGASGKVYPEGMYSSDIGPLPTRRSPGAELLQPPPLKAKHSVNSVKRLTASLRNRLSTPSLRRPGTPDSHQSSASSMTLANEPSTSNSHTPTPILVKDPESAKRKPEPSVSSRNKQSRVTLVAPLPKAVELIVITCIDAPLDTGFDAGFEGDAHVIRNAGGRAQDAIPHILQSIEHSQRRKIVVVHHTECELALSQPRNQTAGAKKSGALTSTNSIKKAVREDMKFLKEHPQLLPNGIEVFGRIVSASGKLTAVEIL